jgi:hypothetical protein
MSGNTRGKLKEHFEGIHKNLDWCVHHCTVSLELIQAQLALTDEYLAAKGDADAEEKVLLQNDMYRAIKGLGEGIATLDELAGGIYQSF